MILAQIEAATNTAPAEEGAQQGSFLSQDRIWELVETYGVPAITALIIILVAFLVASWVSRIVQTSCRRARIEETLAKFFAKLAKWVVLIVAALFCLGEFGIETASFAVVIGAAGLAVGLAFQGTLSNFASGVMLLVFRPYRVGDWVNVAGQSGKVDEVELFTTALDTPDNRRIIIPNSAIFGSTIENVTHHAIRRVDVAVGVAYDADIDQAREVLAAAAKDVPGVLADKDPTIALTNLGNSSVDFAVRVWCNTADYWDVRDATTRAVKLALDDAGISIPFPQMDVHLDQPAPAP